MDALLLTTDLMFSSRATSIAAQLGGSIRVVASTDALDQHMDVQGLRLVLLDLTTAGCDPQRIVAPLRARHSPPTVVAFAPHVLVGKLQAAEAAGCDEVLTRGQFDQQMPALLRRHLGNELRDSERGEG